MYEKYKDKAEFFLIYIREAHPTDGWQVGRNKREGVLVPQPKSIGERADVATQCIAKLDIAFPCLLDDMKNRANLLYSGWPDRLYVIDVDGKIAMKGAPGPRGFRPAAAEQALVKLIGNKGRMPKK